MTTMEYAQIDLYEFLTESELQHYYNAIKNELKITNAAQFKYATDEDLKNIGLSRPEIRRLRKYYEKHFPHGYLSKIKRLLQAPTTIVKRDDGNNGVAQSTNPTTDPTTTTKTSSSPSKAPNNKHIIPADSISVNKQLGTGEFGIVQQGVWTNGTERIQVAIKCLCRERMQSNPMEFLKEAAIMHSIEHENIVRLYGVVLATDSLMLVTELAHLRSLLECLKDSGLRVSFLTIPTLCEFAMQICNGMRYLENKRLIHRDLAARNILVFSKNKVKISDFGLSRALGVGKDYYKTNFNVNLKLPIAWCAPECINYLRFTNASDVWAYGVCLWEMFSYGFQPWAALTGLQILEAIDAPNYQRLEQPDCCPREYYTLMIKCWQDDPAKRPKFGEIYEMLPDMKPEQLKAVVNYCESKKDHLIYRQGEIITVLNRNTGTPYWKGVLSSGNTGYFNPSNTVTFLEGLPSSNRDSFCRVSERSSKRKLRTEMISKPQNDFKHTGHVGIDGASFGDIAFLSSSQSYNHVPRQIVTPYKPSEDIEQTPLLLPPTPTSPDSLQTASGYFADGATSMNPSFVSSTENTPKHIAHAGQSTFEFPQQRQQTPSTNPFAHDEQYPFALQNNNYCNDSNKDAASTWRSTISTEEPHEYHEISDDEITADKLDFGPSLLDEINSMFGSISGASGQQPKSPDFEHMNIKNEFAEITSKLVGGTGSKGDSNGNKFGTSSSSKKKSSGTVKPISVKDEKILNHAIEIANEISARSMIDLVSDQSHVTAAQSPKRKFSFRFPHLSSNGSDKSHNNTSGSAGSSTHGSQPHGPSSPYSKKKNFTEELQSIPDLQAIIGEEGREAYNSLIERKSSLSGGVGLSPAASLLRHLDTNEFDMTNAKTLPRCSMHLRNGTDNGNEQFAIIQTTTATHMGQDATEQMLTIPLQNAPRPMTLPTRGAANRVKKAAELCGDMSKLIQRANGKENNNNNNNGIGFGQEANANDDKLSPCESPSYMTNTFYKFPEQHIVATATTTRTSIKESPNPSTDANPLPLPSREGKKHIKTNAKRHVRKYPLIIPANGVQRTLSKVTDMQTNTSIQAAQQQQQLQQEHQQQQQQLKSASIAGSEQKLVEMVATIRPNLANDRSTETDGKHQFGDAQQHTYQNLEQLDNDVSCTDTASLQFESILEADSNKCNVLQSPDVTDGFYNFSIQKEHYNKGKEVDPNKISGLYVNEDELRNLDIERSVRLNVSNVLMHSIKGTTSTTTTATTSTESITKSNGAQTCDTDVTKTSTAAATTTTSSTTLVTAQQPSSCNTNTLEKQKPNKSSAENELAGNALFKKVRETVDMAMSKPALATASNVTTNDAKSNVSKDTATSANNKQRAQTEAEYFAATAARLADSNSVSCEDLLEFSDKKPKGCERGVDSDEVRIMMKVLGKASTPDRCLHVLEFINWDVHKAIKLIKLQNILSNANLSLTESIEVLQKYDWDLHVTAIKLRALKT